MSASAQSIDYLTEALGYKGLPGLLDLSNTGDAALYRRACADGYKGSRELFNLSRSGPHNGYAYLFRRAFEQCNVKSVYTLNSPHESGAIPLVYLAEAESEKEASAIHRKVWNQNVVPFLVVSTPNRYVLYPGFRYKHDEPALEIAEILKGARLSLESFRGLEADSIANGTIWDHRGKDITLETRVDGTLLRELEQLGRVLRQPPFGLSVHQAHALIGKFVFLRYLRDRQILSDERLAQWSIDPQEVFGRQATLSAFVELNDKLDGWLNGSVFPIDVGSDGIWPSAIGKVAAVFYGDSAAGQLSLFDAYNFAFIPIETLSVIYQQFLHAEGGGKGKGAYYTPVNLVDLILDEVETRRRLVPGTKVLDPACGSGAFLVQVYRRMVERQLGSKGKLRPQELRDLLTRHVFGVDQDEDACRVATLSLVTTLLDYIDPPDLLRYPNFKLPSLFGSNIVQGDFFDPGLSLSNGKFDCIVGNPPWLEIKPGRPNPGQSMALAWIRQNRDECPVGGWQLAEAFAWKVGEQLSTGGAVGLLMPAMSLFKVQSKGFRSRFFSSFKVWCVANFANLAYVLFGGRVEEPAAAFFYRSAKDSESETDGILTYSPFLANQPAMGKGKRRGFKETWALTVDAGELRQVDYHDAQTGEGLTWKIAMWGSHRDRRLLRRVGKRYSKFSDYRKKVGLIAHQGLELRLQDAKELIEPLPELIGAKRILQKEIPRNSRLYDFPDHVLETIKPEQAFARKRGGIKAPLSICKPPHVILSRSREWAVFSNEFLVVPPRQLGIAGLPGQEGLLKALALYLMSDFVRYHQLFHAAEMGVKGSVADKADIEAMPIPFEKLSKDDIKAWAKLYDKLRDCWRKMEEHLLTDTPCFLEELGHKANEMVFDALELSPTDRWLVTDLVHGRMQMIKGKMVVDHKMSSSTDELQAYGKVLLSTLNTFLNDQRHSVDIYAAKEMAIVAITLNEKDNESLVVRIHEATHSLSSELAEIHEQLVSQHTHWLYFERRLTLYHGNSVYLVKPIQRRHWMRSQALLDADNLIADMLSGSEYQA